MAIKVKVNVTIERPVKDVFEFLSNLENSPVWGRTERTTKLTDGSISVGTKFHEEIRFMGRKMESTNEITEYDPPSAFSYVNRMGDNKEERARFTFTAVGEGTRINGTGEGEMGGLADFIAPITSWMSNRRIRSLFKKFKAVLEAPDRSAVR